jgi:hypothetical protein
MRLYEFLCYFHQEKSRKRSSKVITDVLTMTVSTAAVHFTPRAHSPEITHYPLITGAWCRSFAPKHRLEVSKQPSIRGIFEVIDICYSRDIPRA